MAFERFKSKPNLPQYEVPDIRPNDYDKKDHFHPRPKGFLSNVKTLFGLTSKYKSMSNQNKLKIQRGFFFILALVAIWRLFLVNSSSSLGHSPPPSASFKTISSYLGGISKLPKNAIANFEDQPVGQIERYDFGQLKGTKQGWKNKEYLLLCIPLRNAVPVLPMMVSHIENLTYPHHLIDIAFLVSDSDDSTEFELGRLLQQSNIITQTFHNIEIFHKDFGAVIGQGFDDRHGVKVQGVRRKLMGRARNWLTSVALKPYHSWVYWRDADVEVAPATIIEDLMKHDRDVIVPNVWRPLPEWLGGEQPYDLNSWQESDPALELAKTLDEDDVIVEGYVEYPTWRAHLAYFREPEGNPDDMFDLDGIGGVSILARAKVFRQGAMFPGFALWNHAETEGFGKLCRKMGFTVSGLPHYTIWHIYEPSEEDLVKMKEMDEEKEREAKGLPSEKEKDDKSEKPKTKEEATIENVSKVQVPDKSKQEAVIEDVSKVQVSNQQKTEAAN